MTLTIGSLFSGYGGLDQAVAEVFGADVAWHVEYDSAPSKILAHHYPGVPNYGDVTTCDWATMPPIDILTGGYPCQPFSAAGKRKGTDDERHLWPYAREAIRVLRPRYTLLENVAGHRSLGFDRVLGDLAEDGFDAVWTSIRASDVGAPHHRERLFILAHPPGGTPENHLRKKPGRKVVTDLAILVENDLLASGGVVLPTPTVGNATGTNERRGGKRGDELLLPGVAVAYAAGDLLPTPTAGLSTGGPDYARADRVGSGGDDLITIAARAEKNRGTNWGKYAPAIRRWESLTRPAPAPTEPNRNGRPRLNARFAEWMMGLADGHVTDVPDLSRADQLKAIGNGVCPPQAVAALHQLLAMEAAGA